MQAVLRVRRQKTPRPPDRGASPPGDGDQGIAPARSVAPSPLLGTHARSARRPPYGPTQRFGTVRRVNKCGDATADAGYCSRAFLKAGWPKAARKWPTDSHIA